MGNQCIAKMQWQTVCALGYCFDWVYEFQRPKKCLKRTEDRRCLALDLCSNGLKESCNFWLLNVAEFGNFGIGQRIFFCRKSGVVGWKLMTVPQVQKACRYDIRR